jgi:hypothetical protein
MSPNLPILLALSWATGYAIFSICAVVGLIVVARPVKRRLSEVSPNYVEPAKNKKRGSRG